MTTSRTREGGRAAGVRAGAGAGAAKLRLAVPGCSSTVRLMTFPYPAQRDPWVSEGGGEGGEGGEKDEQDQLGCCLSSLAPTRDPATAHHAGFLDGLEAAAAPQRGPQQLGPVEIPLHRGLCLPGRQN